MAAQPVRKTPQGGPPARPPRAVGAPPPPPPVPPAGPRLRLEERFTLDSLPKLRRLVLAQLAALAGCGVVIFLLLNRDPPPAGFAMRSIDGGMLPGIDVADPQALSQSEINTWVAERVRQMFTYDSDNWERKRPEILANFTTPGWNGIPGNADWIGGAAALERYGALGSIRRGDISIHCRILGAPVIVSSTVANGAFTATVSVPARISRWVKDTENPINVTVYLAIRQVPLAFRGSDGEVQVRSSPLIIEGVGVRQEIRRSLLIDEADK
jgi:hypothetical protein